MSAQRITILRLRNKVIVSILCSLARLRRHLLKNTLLDWCQTPVKNEGMQSRYFVETAAKVLDILETFSSEQESLSITEIARRTGLTYSSAFRLLYTLETRGYVMRRAGKKRYLLSPARRRFR